MKEKGLVFALVIVLLLSAGWGCAQKAAKVPDCEALYASMEALGKFPEMVRRDDDLVHDYYGIDPAQCRQLVNYATADGLLADEVLLVEATEEDYAVAVEQLLKDQLSHQAETLRDYMPEEYEKVSAAKIERQGSFVLMIVSNDADLIYSVYLNAIK